MPPPSSRGILNADTPPQTDGWDGQVAEVLLDLCVQPLAVAGREELGDVPGVLGSAGAGSVKRTTPARGSSRSPLRTSSTAPDALNGAQKAWSRQDRSVARRSMSYVERLTP